MSSTDALPVAEVITTLKCPHCGRELELLEFRREVCMVCWACLHAACLDTQRTRRQYFARGRLDWHGLVEDLYWAYAGS